MSVEVYVSTDIEVDGPIPGAHSMLSIGSAAYGADSRLLATFSANLEPLPNATQHPDTMAWWVQNPAAWAAARTNPQPPATVMQNYVEWLEQLPGVAVFVGYPAGFDFMFVYWYLFTFVGKSPFARRALDVRTFAMAHLKAPYLAVGREQLPEDYQLKLPHTHHALDDALEQGTIFCRLLQENRQTQGGAI